MKQTDHTPTNTPLTLKGRRYSGQGVGLPCCCWPETHGHSGEKVSPPCSALLDYLKAGNVSSVLIKGIDITGQFLTQMTWSENPTPVATVAGDAQITPATGTLYSSLRIKFPEVQGDPNLLELGGVSCPFLQGAWN